MPFEDAVLSIGLGSGLPNPSSETGVLGISLIDEDITDVLTKYVVL